MRLRLAALIPPISSACFQVLLPGGLGSVLALVEEQLESPSCILEGVEVTFGSILSGKPRLNHHKSVGEHQ